MIFAESANSLLGYVRAGRLSVAGARARLRWLKDLPLEIVIVAEIVDSTIDFALGRDLSAYDAAYFAVAAAADATLVTADAGLAAAYPRSVLLA